MKDLVIIGAGGFAREVAWLAERINEATPTWNLLGFLDDDKGKRGEEIDGFPVLGSCCSWKKFKDAWIVCAVGAAKTRRAIIERMRQEGATQFATLVDPSVIQSKRVKIGEGCIICANTIVTVEVVMGSHVIVNLACTIGHDAQLHDFTTLYPAVNISGFTVLEECVEMGTGSQIIQGKRVGAETIVGAGAVVVRDLPGGYTAVGVPAVVK